MGDVLSAGGRNRFSVTSGGIVRRAVVYRPRRASGDRPLPLVLNLHGSGSTAHEQSRMSELEDSAERHGFLVAAPQGAVRTGAGYAWNVPYVTALPGAPDDEAFLGDLIDALVESAHADPARVYAAGLSGGGRLVSQFAADHPDRLAAIAPVAGLRAGAPLARHPTIPDPTTCAPARPVPVVAFHGTADPVNPFGGGGPAYWSYSALTALARWAEVNGCGTEPTVERVTEHVSVVAHAGCRNGADTLMYVVDGGGHTWPGSSATFPTDVGAVNQEISASEIMWRFFANRRAGMTRDRS